MAIKVYGTANCTQCSITKKYLTSKNIPYEFVDVSKNHDSMEYLTSRGFSKLPVVMTSNQESYCIGFDAPTINNLIKEEEESNGHK